MIKHIKTICKYSLIPSTILILVFTALYEIKNYGWALTVSLIVGIPWYIYIFIGWFLSHKYAFENSFICLLCLIIVDIYFISIFMNIFVL